MRSQKSRKVKICSLILALSLMFGLACLYTACNRQAMDELMLKWTLTYLLHAYKNQSQSIDAEKYTSYVCYDYHLACLDAESDGATAEVTCSEDDGTGHTSKVRFRQIIGASDDQFISATVLPGLLLGASEHVVMQNPDNYVDVLADWTIKTIELYYVDYKHPIEQDELATIPSRVLASTSDMTCASELKECILADHDTEALPDGYTVEHRNDETYYVFYIRIHFNESENIVWDSELISFLSKEGQDRIIQVDMGRKPNDLATPSSKNTSIGDYAHLYAWISDAIDSISSK